MIKDYKIYRQVFHPHLLNLVKTQMEMEIKAKCRQFDCTEEELVKKVDDTLNTNSYCSYGSNFTQALMFFLRDFLSNETGKDLVPTYTYWRKYRKGSSMRPHVDRPSCEYSITACIGLEGNPWPIHFKNLDGSVESVFMQPGDFVLYKGMEIQHWRNEFVEGDVCFQAFLHYVDKNGPCSEWAYDKNV